MKIEMRLDECERCLIEALRDARSNYAVEGKKEGLTQRVLTKTFRTFFTHIEESIKAGLVDVSAIPYVVEVYEEDYDQVTLAFSPRGKIT